MLLDDTTSALDPETEVRVLTRLQERAREMTVIAVASRPTTIALADKVIFLGDSSVKDYGTHEELLLRQPEYAALMEAFAEDRSTVD
jgi:ABC-type multidrug transport system fused ATPase/permease subunit